MIGTGTLYFLSTLFFISILSAVCLVILALALIIDVLRKKEIKNKKLKISTLVVLSLIVCLALPHWCLYLALMQDDLNNTEKFAKIAIKTAIDPKVRCIGYEMLENVYKDDYRGQAAIEAGEKFISSCRCNTDVSKWRVNPPQPGEAGCASHTYSMYNSLCMLYTIKGDLVNGIRTCGVADNTHVSVATNYIINDEYDLALEAMNKEFEDNKKVNSLMYATRALIYEHLGQQAKAESDYNAARETAPLLVEKIRADKDYFKNNYAKIKTLYDFSE